MTSRPSKRILVVDDEPSMREMLGIMLGKEGYDVVLADSRAMAAAVLARAPVDMVITDVKLGDGDGIEILRHVKAASAETAVVVMTAYGSTETAVAALKLGAHDYLIKPFDVDELKIVVRNALEKRRLEEENVRLKAELRTHHALERMVGVSPAMAALFDLVRSVAPTGSTVLIQGESGTGKELVVRAIHALSPRKDAAFV
ncbi:MAG TPA: response regulator, partial [Vicinamibacteria bacterium]|nr:response regulator [Vicinamibacteria bacterium]